jgi:ribosomal protein S18 acetylase RimI-like enzyme
MKKPNPSEAIAIEIAVEQAPRSETKLAADTLQRAFANNAIIRFMASAARDPNAAAHENFTQILARARVNGVVMRTSANYEGVAVWFLTGFARSSLAHDMGIAWYKLRSFRLQQIAGLVPFYLQVEKAHIRIIRQPHYYLEILGVDPRFQGQGFSSRLLRPVLEHADAQRKMCYLETQGSKNVALYEHFGFQVVETLSVYFDQEPYSLMLRKPATQSSYFFNT